MSLNDRSRMRQYQVPPRIRLARALMRPVFRGLFHLLSPVQITGLENVPVRGAYLIAANHISLYEAPLVLAFWPLAPEAVGAIDIWSRTGQSTLVRMYGGIPVHRGEYDRRLLDTMVNVLRSGLPLMIAPEGGRSHTPGMRRGKPGVAYVVDKVGVPVVPVGVVGTVDEYFQLAVRGKRPPLEMHIGQPLHLPPVEGRGGARRVALQRNTDRIMSHVAALLPSEYRGVYADEKFLAP